MKRLSLILLAIICGTTAKAQTIPTDAIILTQLKADLIKTDQKDSRLLTPTGFNVFMQRKAVTYLTGASDLSLAKFYGTYSSDEASNRLTLGYNIPFTTGISKLKWIFNPIVEADVKSNFATLYKDEDWQNNVRAGLKVSYLFGNSSLNFWGKKSKNYRKNDFSILRKNTYEALKARWSKESLGKTAAVKLVDDSTIVYPTAEAQLSYKQMKKRKQSAYQEIGIAEADYLDKEKAYTWYKTMWISAWTFVPVTEADHYTSIDKTTTFQKTKFKLWEINLQYTFLIDNSRLGSLYASPWVKYYHNNSANADLMTKVDYELYSQFPGTDTLNLALLKTNKAYIGEFKEFNTFNLNLQLVYIAPLPNALFRPGLSIRYEKNWGDYSPANWRFGLPIAIQGKEKPVNIEFQYRRNDVGNYANKVNFKKKEAFGLSLGLPFTLLYK